MGCIVHRVAKGGTPLKGLSTCPLFIPFKTPKQILHYGNNLTHRDSFFWKPPTTIWKELTLYVDFPGGSVVKNPLANAGDTEDTGQQFYPWDRKISWSRKRQPTPVILSRKFQGQRSLVGCSPWGCRVRGTKHKTFVYPPISDWTFVYNFFNLCYEILLIYISNVKSTPV